jgi:hypothetical protein
MRWLRMNAYLVSGTFARGVKLPPKAAMTCKMHVAEYIRRDYPQATQFFNQLLPMRMVKTGIIYAVVKTVTCKFVNLLERTLSR